MDGSSMPTSPLESVSKSVQELATDSDAPPENYFYRGSDGAIDLSSPIIDIPVIDLNLLASSAEQELAKLKSSLISSGCFQAINHGMTSSFLDEVDRVGREFFALPLEEKQKYSRTAGDIEGYGNDSLLYHNQTLDWTDRLYLITHPLHQRKFQVWPQSPQVFREILDQYTKNLKMLNELILKAMAKCLNLKEDIFLNQYGENGIMVARYNYYPPCSRPDLILGVKPHADGSAVTFLLQDKEVEGLQVRIDDQWLRVPIFPHALLINVGDQVEIMSNGIFKSPLHRVVTNSERERMTLAVFCIPESTKEIEPAEDLVSETKPRLYKKVKNYVDIYFQNYQQGKRPIDAAKF